MTPEFRSKRFEPHIRPRRTKWEPLTYIGPGTTDYKPRYIQREAEERTRPFEIPTLGIALDSGHVLALQVVVMTFMLLSVLIYAKVLEDLLVEAIFSIFDISSVDPEVFKKEFLQIQNLRIIYFAVTIITVAATAASTFLARYIGHTLKRLDAEEDRRVGHLKIILSVFAILGVWVFIAALMYNVIGGLYTSNEMILIVYVVGSIIIVGPVAFCGTIAVIAKNKLMGVVAAFIMCLNVAISSSIEVFSTQFQLEYPSPSDLLFPVMFALVLSMFLLTMLNLADHWGRWYEVLELPIIHREKDRSLKPAKNQAETLMPLYWRTLIILVIVALGLTLLPYVAGLFLSQYGPYFITSSFESRTIYLTALLSLPIWGGLICVFFIRKGLELRIIERGKQEDEDAESDSVWGKYLVKSDKDERAAEEFEETVDPKKLSKVAKKLYAEDYKARKRAGKKGRKRTGKKKKTK